MGLINASGCILVLIISLITTSFAADCQRYATASDTEGLDTWPCGENVERACRGLSMATTFYDATNKTICLLQGVYTVSGTDPINIWLLMNLVGLPHATIIPSPVSQPLWPIFNVSSSNPDYSEAPLSTTIANITFTGFRTPQNPSGQNTTFIRFAGPTNTYRKWSLEFTNVVFTNITINGAGLIRSDSAIVELRGCTLTDIRAETQMDGNIGLISTDADLGITVVDSIFERILVHAPSFAVLGPCLKTTVLRSTFNISSETGSLFLVDTTGSITVTDSTLFSKWGIGLRQNACPKSFSSQCELRLTNSTFRVPRGVSATAESAYIVGCTFEADVWALDLWTSELQLSSCSIRQTSLAQQAVVQLYAQPPAKVSNSLTWTITHSSFSAWGSTDPEAISSFILIMLGALDHEFLVELKFNSFAAAPDSTTKLIRAIQAPSGAAIQAWNNWYGDYSGPQSCCTFGSKSKVAFQPGVDFSNWSTTDDFTEFSYARVSDTCALSRCIFLPPWGTGIISAIGIILVIETAFMLWCCNRKRAPAQDFKVTEDDSEQTLQLLSESENNSDSTVYTKDTVAWPSQGLLRSYTLISLNVIALCIMGTVLARYFPTLWWFSQLSNSGVQYTIDRETIMMAFSLLAIVDIGLQVLRIVVTNLLNWQRKHISPAVARAYFAFGLIVAMTTVGFYLTGGLLLAVIIAMSSFLPSDELFALAFIIVLLLYHVVMLVLSVRAFNELEAPLVAAIQDQVSRSQTLLKDPSKTYKDATLRRYSRVMIGSYGLYLMASLAPVLLIGGTYVGVGVNSRFLIAMPLAQVVLGLYHFSVGVYAQNQYHHLTWSLVAWLQTVVLLVVHAVSLGIVVFSAKDDLIANVTYTLPTGIATLTLLVQVIMLPILRSFTIHRLPGVAATNISAAYNRPDIIEPKKSNTRAIIIEWGILIVAAIAIGGLTFYAVEQVDLQPVSFDVLGTGDSVYSYIWTPFIAAANLSLDRDRDGASQYAYNTLPQNFKLPLQRLGTNTSFGTSNDPEALNNPYKEFEIIPHFVAGVGLLSNVNTTTPLVLTPDVLIKVISGEIESWADPALVALNPELASETRKVSFFSDIYPTGSNYAISEALLNWNSSLWKPSSTWPGHYQHHGISSPYESSLLGQLAQNTPGLAYAVISPDLIKLLPGCKQVRFATLRINGVDLRPNYTTIEEGAQNMIMTTLTNFPQLHPNFNLRTAWPLLSTFYSVTPRNYTTFPNTLFRTCKSVKKLIDFIGGLRTTNETFLREYQLHLPKVPADSQLDIYAGLDKVLCDARYPTPILHWDYVAGAMAAVAVLLVGFIRLFVTWKVCRREESIPPQAYIDRYDDED